MARKKIKPLDLTSAVNELLQEYGNEVYEVMDDSVDTVAKEAAQRLKSVNHFAPGRNPSGKYSESWTVDTEKTGRLAVTRVVHNQDYYRLTHLLENGHVSRNGTGRTFGRVPAYPHIAPVNEWASDELPKLVKQRLER